MSGPWEAQKVPFEELEDVLNGYELRGYSIVQLVECRVVLDEQEDDLLLVVARKNDEQEEPS